MLYVIFFAQCASSLKRTLQVNAVTAGITSQVISGNWIAIAAAVTGGAIGNTAAMIIKTSYRRKAQ
jgi:hypothetical protein